MGLDFLHLVIFEMVGLKSTVLIFDFYLFHFSIYFSSFFSFFKKDFIYLFIEREREEERQERNIDMI